MKIEAIKKSMLEILVDKEFQKTLRTALANIKWSAFPSASPLTGAEQIVGLQSGLNVQMALQTNLLAYIQKALTPSATTVFTSSTVLSSFPDSIVCNFPSSGGTIQLPSALNVPYDIAPFVFCHPDGQPVQILDGSGDVLFTINPDQSYQTVLLDNSSVAGTWDDPRPVFMSLNNINGNASLTSLDSTVTLDIGTQTIDFSVASILEDYFLIANNFSEIAADPTSARSNLGFATGYINCNLAQNYVLTNPAPKIIGVNIPSTGYSIALPPVGSSGDVQSGENILIQVNSLSSATLLTDANGVNIGMVTPGSSYIAINVSDVQSAPQWYLVSGGALGSPDMQATYDQGSLVNLTQGQPIVFSAGQSIVGPNQYLFKNYSTAGYNISANTMFGESFTCNTAGYITAFLFADNQLPSGSREVALWLYTDVNNGTLIYSDFVSKSDPLDPTGKWRVHAITPIPIAANTRYVISALHLAGDFVLFYQGPQPDFGVINGNNYPGYINTVLIYPRPQNNVIAPMVLGNQNLLFQSITNTFSELTVQDSTISSAYIQVQSTIQGTVLDPPMLSSDFAAISPKIAGLGAFASDIGCKQYFDGTEIQTLLTLAHLKSGTNIILTDNGDGTLTVAASGSSFSVGASAYYNIVSGSSTSFSGSSPVLLNCTVNTSKSTDMTVGPNGSITATSAVTANFQASISGRSSATANVFYFYFAINGVVDTNSLQPIYFSNGVPGNAGNQANLLAQYTLNPGDVVQVYIANPGSLSNSFIAQNMSVSAAQDLASSATLQSAYNNGNIIQGNQNTRPFQVNNSSGNPILQGSETFCNLPQNYGNWVPTFSNLSGIAGSITLNTARYIVQGAGVLCTISGSFTANNSSISFDCALPIAPGFTTAAQASYVGGNLSASPPTVADGNVVSYASNTSAQTITATLNSTVGSGSYTFNLSFLYEVQP